jgi:hypothetical protein
MAEKRESNDSYLITKDGGVSYPSGNDSKGISIAVNIDCNEALTGLKAITREAKKATAALKELEAQQKKNKGIAITLDGKEISTLEAVKAYCIADKETRARWNEL